MQPQQDLDHSAQARKCPATSWTCRWKFQCKTYASIHFRTPKESKRLEIGVVTESFLNQYEEIKLYIKKRYSGDHTQHFQPWISNCNSYIRVALIPIVGFLIVGITKNFKP